MSVSKLLIAIFVGVGSGCYSRGQYLDVAYSSPVGIQPDSSSADVSARLQCAEGTEILITAWTDSLAMIPGISINLSIEESPTKTLLLALDSAVVEVAPGQLCHFEMVQVGGAVQEARGELSTSINRTVSMDLWLGRVFDSTAALSEFWSNRKPLRVSTPTILDENRNVLCGTKSVYIFPPK